MKPFMFWLQQPTSVAGLAAIIGTLSAMATGLLRGQAALRLFAPAAGSIMLPDRAGAAGATAALVEKIAMSINSKETSK